MFLRKLLFTGALTAAAAALGSAASAEGVNSRWYRRLRKPGYQPPAAVFPVVWAGLYASIALASAAALAAGERMRRAERAQPAASATQRNLSATRARGFRRSLLANLGLNALWSWAFFRWHNLPLARVVAFALSWSSTGLARGAGRLSRGSGWALAPYALWTTFASMLTGSIRRLNRRK